QNAIASWLLSELEDDALEAALEAFCTPAIDVELPLQLRCADEIIAEVRTASTTWQATPAIVATIRDVTDRYRAEQNLRYLATHDDLTGLLNRSAFRERIEACFSRCREDGGQFAILFVDLDRFKFVNDSLGHIAGDRLLRYFAAALSAAVPADAPHAIARIGGDEFAILLEGIHSVEQIEDIRRRLNDALSEPVDIDGVRIYLSFSTGVAIGPDPYDNVDELVRESDRAMYRAKAERHGEQISYALAKKTSQQDLLRLESALREAIQRSEIRAWLQPIVDLQTGKLAGFESLARWHRPDGRVVSPAEFIPLAEQTGLILKLGQQMLEDACAQLASWQNGRLAGCFLSVNLSARHLSQPNLFRYVSELLTKYGVAPETLVLEVTEEALLQDDVEAESVLGLLSDLGVGIAIDDFGTGYSSLDRLRRLPVQKLKMDRCFVEHIATCRREREICRAIVALGRNLGMDIVAEGIETPRQSRLLREMGCNAGQGFLFARPLAPEDVPSCPDVFLDDTVEPLLTAEAA
ncbi:MAG: bifunctional diguanylate cyclase/phosphodiesterase, partial [Candidatus Dadabacteria bacterium]